MAKYSVISSFILWLLIISRRNQFWFPTLLKIWRYLIYQLVCLDWFVNTWQMNQLLSAWSKPFNRKDQTPTCYSKFLCTSSHPVFPPSVFLLLKKAVNLLSYVTFFYLLYSVYPRIAQCHIYKFHIPLIEWAGSRKIVTFLKLILQLGR